MKHQEQMNFLEANDFIERYQREPEIVKEELKACEKKLDQTDPEYSNVVLSGRIHTVTPISEAKKNIAEILAKLKESK